jgi:pyruvate dehydrogenase E2 component (dihydrolipoamide acetyltransferase)
VIPLRLGQLSIAMEEGRVVAWLVPDGARVAQGEPVVEIETDKANVEVEAPAAGTLRIVAAVGAVVPLDGLLAEIGDAVPAAAPAPASGEHATAGPARPPRPGGGGNGGHVASPAARRLARELSVDAAALAGSGPDGRVVVRDVERAAATGRPARVADLRAAVVAGVVASWHEVPHINIGGELDAEGLAEARLLAAGRAERVTVTDLLVVAVAGALADVPELNGTRRPDGSVERASAVHLALAVATEHGLAAPVIRDAGRLGVLAVARERARLVAAARRGSLDRRDLAAGTCTLSNLGAHPVDFFTPVVAAPQVCLVAVGRLAQRPVALDGLLGVRHRIWVNAAIDHRSADGEAGGRFLAALERRLAGLPTTVRAEEQGER